jgi:hypothetical protein
MAQPNLPSPEAVLEQLGAEVHEASFLPAHSRDLWFFAYDIHLDQEYVARYVRGLIPFKVVYVPHQRLSFPHYHPPEDSGLPTLERTNDPDDKVWGLIYDAKPVPGQDEKRDFRPMERHLHVPGRYRKATVHTLDRGGRRYPAFTYVLNLDDGRQTPPSENYLARWVDCAKERRLPDEWIAYLESLRGKLGSAVQ